MDFYNYNDSFENYEGIQTKEREITKTLAQNHPTFSSPQKNVKKFDKFSKLSAEERWNFSQKIKQLQTLINAIQADMNADISSGFTLEEVLEVLNVRRAMHNGFEK